MSNISRVGVSIEDELLESFDQLNSDRGYDNRSEAVRDLIRDALVQSRLEAPQDKAVEVLGSLTLVYDHHASDLTNQMTELQHQHEGIVVSVLHVHINHDDCMELIALRGRADEVRSLADGLLSLKGVKHGKLFVTLPSHAMTGRAPTTRKHKHPHTHSNQASHRYG
jgi:CopG family nickel-responsive transcriptional regulator